MQKQFWITISSAIAIDYLIARFLASKPSEVLFIFSILILAPMFFSLKSAAVRYLLWKIFGSNAGTEKYYALMTKHKWPKPNSEFEDAMNYLERVVENSETEEQSKIVAAQLMGAIQALFDTHQVIGAWLETSTFKTAMKKYENNFN